MEHGIVHDSHNAPILEYEWVIFVDLCQFVSYDNFVHGQRHNKKQETNTGTKYQ